MCDYTQFAVGAFLRNPAQINYEQNPQKELASAKLASAKHAGLLDTPNLHYKFSDDARSADSW